MTAARQTPQHRSPLHECLAHLHPVWCEVHGTPAALTCAVPSAEAAVVRKLALADASALPRVTVKGPQAPALLHELGLAVPDAMFAVRPQGQAGIAARTGATEFFIEDGPADNAVARVHVALGPFGSARPGVYRALRADASILVSGGLAPEALAQTCGYDLREAPPDRLVFTRVAGVSCSVLPRLLPSGSAPTPIPAVQIWADGTYGEYLWEELLEIARELGGSVAGLASFFPGLSTPSSHHT